MSIVVTYHLQSDLKKKEKCSTKPFTTIMLFSQENRETYNKHKLQKAEN